MACLQLSWATISRTQLTFAPIALGSASQIALFVAPALVLLSYVVGPSPMSLQFWPGAVTMVMIATVTASFITSSGRSAWFVGALLIFSHGTGSSCGQSRKMQMAFPRARSNSFLTNCVTIFRQYPVATAVAAAATLLAATAVVNGQLARKAQRDNPPKGKFIEVDGYDCTTSSAERVGLSFCFTATAA
jgi:hypothetical protein